MRILLLDARAGDFIDSLPKGVEIISAEKKDYFIDGRFHQHDPYKVDRRLERILWSHNSSADCDLIVVGNNTGIGATYAAQIAPGLRGQTIITFYKELDERDRSDYEQLGFTRFIAREQIIAAIQAAIEAEKAK